MTDPFRAPDFGEDEFFPDEAAEAAEVTEVTEQSVRPRERTRPSAGRRAPRRRAA
ncbi:hypothetical protein [Streptomyces sp. DSM 41921]|uniref:Uncharacterized protein n=1 Tax=Streptomyces dubilierae TaxID=3075533 RepID=A0ABU2PKW7_9ACTN|nr:hypothetical protein [Streptomyces sp. DSM 41921]MDT0392467.1 hypothetical protein [Streptomyces sp. DSM 41921]